MEYAKVLQRLKAFLLDYVLILLYVGSLVVVAIFLFPSIQVLFTQSVMKAQFFGFVLVTLPISLYFAVFDSKIGKQTFGKKVLQLRVVTKDGQVPSFLHSLLRISLKFLPWELSHFLVYQFVASSDDSLPYSLVALGAIVYGLVIVYFVTAIFSKKKQSLYDVIVKTYVVKSI